MSQKGKVGSEKFGLVLMKSQNELWQKDKAHVFTSRSTQRVHELQCTLKKMQVSLYYASILPLLKNLNAC